MYTGVNHHDDGGGVSEGLGRKSQAATADWATLKGSPNPETRLLKPQRAKRKTSAPEVELESYIFIHQNLGGGLEPRSDVTVCGGK